jgi:diguanylate cyclase (GGDEF)-like protein
MDDFVREGGDDFVAENLDDSIFANLGIDLFLVFNREGHAAFERYKNHLDGTPILGAEFTAPFLWRASPALSANSPAAATLVRLQNGTLLQLAAQSVTRSDGSGTPSGSVLVGRIVGPEVLAELRGRVRLQFTLKPPGSWTKSPERVPVLEGDHMTVGFGYKNAKGETVASIELTRRANIIAQGHRTLSITTISTLVVLSVVLVFLLLILQFSIVTPLGELSKTITQIQSTGDLATRVALGRSDEIGKLAENFDKMLAQLGERAERLEKLASSDELTGLNNRRFIMEYLRQEVESAARYGYELSILLLDVDHFKRINDTAGHATGDRVLANLGSILRSTLRDSDRVGRYGGEEFLVVLPHQGSTGALAVAERVRRAVEASDGHGVTWTLTVSIGAATWEGQSREALLFSADKNLYRAKSEGRNRVVARVVTMEELPGSSLLRGATWSKMPPSNAN